jgi:hypothetical protein
VSRNHGYQICEPLGNRGCQEPRVSDLFSVTLTPAVPAYLARFGPTTPKRAGRLADTSVDPSDAGRAARRCFGRSDRSAQQPRSNRRCTRPSLRWWACRSCHRTVALDPGSGAGIAMRACSARDSARALAARTVSPAGARLRDEKRRACILHPARGARWGPARPPAAGPRLHAAYGCRPRWTALARLRTGVLWPCPAGGIGCNQVGQCPTW